MKFKELVDDVLWEDVKQSLSKFYDMDEECLFNHQIVFEKLKYIDPVENDMRIIVDWAEPDGNIIEDGYWYVDGKNGTLQKETEDYQYFKDKCTEEFANSEVGFALDFTPWNKWLGMDIDPETANDIRLMRADIVAHCLYEMTFMGYDEEEIQCTLNGLKDQIKNIEKMSEEELRANSITLDELKERLKKLEEDIENGPSEED